MLVSVVVPCYNAENFLKKCVDSILEQTYKDLEIILVDDLSVDSTRDIIKNLASNYKNIIPFYSKSNNGPGGAKNEGLKIAKGSYVMFVDSDDYLDDNYIEKMVDEVKNDLSVDIVISNFKSVNSDGNVLYYRKYKNEKIALWQSFPTWGKLYNIKWLKDNNLSIPYGKVFEDILFQAAKILCEPKCVVCDTFGYNYLLNEKSISHTTLCSFKKGSLKKETTYLKKLKKYATNDEKMRLLEYFSFRSICWHLLKSGCAVGKENMLNEYDTAFAFLKKEFPKFSSNKKLRIFSVSNDRFLVHKAVSFICFLYRWNLSRKFFEFYGRVNLSRLWPKM